MTSASSSVLFRPLTRALRNVYGASGLPPAAASALAREQPLQKVLRGLTQWSALDLGRAQAPSSSVAAAALAPKQLAAMQADLNQLLEPLTITSARMDQAAGLLRTHGLTALADTLPMALLLRRLRGGSAPGAASSHAAASGVPKRAAGPLDGTRALEQADFHQVLGLVSAHPSLALALGLRMDLTMPAIPGRFAMRTGGLPWQLAGGRPWSAVVCDPQSGRFTMASEPGAPSEIVNGMLDLRSDGEAAEKYVVTTMDVVGMTEQLDSLARSASASVAQSNPPARRNTGITLAQVDRRATTIQHMVMRGQQLSAAFGRPEAIDLAAAAQPVEAAAPSVGNDGESVLFADDVTAGYRVDVRTSDGVWRSLMRRVITYTAGAPERPIVLSADDEGMVDPVIAVQQHGADGVPRVDVGEDLFTWQGYGLAVPMPGASVTIDAQGRARSELIARQSSSQYPLAMQVAAAPGTLPRLRFSAPGCHLSQSVVLDPIQLPPARTLTALIVGQERVELKVTGRWMNNNVFEAALFTRAPDPLASAIESDVFSEVPGSWRVLSAPTSTDLISVTGSIAISRVGTPNPEWFAGRIRVRELQKGESLHSMSEGPVTQPLGGANRATWLDVVDPAELTAVPA
jgi:hypothetical protein